MKFSQNEGQEFLNEFFRRLQRNEPVRKGLAVLLVLAIAALLVNFLWGLLPRRYTLTITGGEVLGNRHFLAKMLADEAVERGITLVIRPTGGSLEALAKVSRGDLDLAFVQGGLDNKLLPNIEHVATVMPEVLHLLVRPGIRGIEDLKGKRINMGSRKGGTRIIVHEVLRFSGLREGIDYLEKNFGEEGLSSMHPGLLPEVIFILSAPPSHVVEYLVRARGYSVRQIPFPPALALRYGWVASEKIFAYTYQVYPPEPARDVESVGVNLHLVANARVKREAVFRVLETLYSAQLANRLRRKIDPARLTLPSGYPLSAGSLDYLKKDDPVLSMKNLDKAENLFGAFVSIISAVLILLRWFKGPERKDAGQEQTGDKR